MRYLHTMRTLSPSEEVMSTDCFCTKAKHKALGFDPTNNRGQRGLIIIFFSVLDLSYCGCNSAALQTISSKKALEQEVIEGWLPGGIFP